MYVGCGQYRATTPSRFVAHGFHLLNRQHYAAIGADGLKVAACKLFEFEQRRVAPVFSQR